MRVIKGLQVPPRPLSKPPITPTFRDIANLIACVAMFYFLKVLSAFRIDKEPTVFRRQLHRIREAESAADAFESEDI